MAELSHTHKVNIIGENFQIKSDVPADEIEKIAGYVDYKIKEISSASVNGDKLKACVLSAMNIAGELFEARNQLEEQRKYSQGIDSRLQTLTDSLDLATEADTI